MNILGVNRYKDVASELLPELQAVGILKQKNFHSFFQSI